MAQLTHGGVAGNDPATLNRPDQIEEIGIAAGTVVMTLDGAIPVELLSPGDRIVTRSGRRILRALDSRTLSGMVVRIGADVLGGGRPQAPMTLACGQKVRIADWRAQMLYDTPEAHVAISRLVDGEHVVRVPTCRLRLFSLRLDEEEVIYAGGMELVSGAPVTVGV